MNEIQKIFLIIWVPVMIFMLWQIFMITPENIRFGILINVFFMMFVWFCFGTKEENEKLLGKIPGVRWIIN